MEIRCKNSPELVKRIEQETSVTWYSDTSKTHNYLCFNKHLRCVEGGGPLDPISEDEFITAIQKDFPPKDETPKRKFKVGDKVRVIGGYNYHNFNRCEVVKLVRKLGSPDIWDARDNGNHEQTICEPDFEPIEDTTPVVAHYEIKKSTFDLNAGSVKYENSDLSSIRKVIEEQWEEAVQRGILTGEMPIVTIPSPINNIKITGSWPLDAFENYTLTPSDPIWEVL